MKRIVLMFQGYTLDASLESLLKFAFNVLGINHEETNGI